MGPPAQPADRHDPMPGLFGLPGHLLRQLSPGARKVVLAAAAVLVAAAVVTAIVLGPRIAESNRERSAEQRQAERKARAAELARLRAEQRPRTGRIASGAPIAGVEAAITRDAHARLSAGELETRVRRTDCHPVGHDAADRLLLACTAVTSAVAPSETTSGVLIGYPYRGAVAPRTGRYAICKTSGRPGEGSYTRRTHVGLPKACGG
jgi:hypothetical protein